MTPYAIHLFNGDTILLTPGQYANFLALWDKGAEEFTLGVQRINRKSISRIGFHTGSAEMLRVARTENYMLLSPQEQTELKEAEYRIACLQSAKREAMKLIEAKQMLEESKSEWGGVVKKIERVREVENKEALPMSSKQEEDGDMMYYLGENGEKCYS
ncbi:MAG: hypothetical protein WC803_12750 [Sphingomonas sp.]|jgi:hypothetical protein